MADLKSCFESEGFSAVKTVLNTGNVIFTADLAPTVSQLEQAFTRSFGFASSMQVFALTDLLEIIAGYPFVAQPDAHSYLIFVRDLTADVALELISTAGDGELVSADGDQRVIYWQVNKGLTLKSLVNKSLQRAELKTKNTVRNINTLNRIIAAA